MESSAVTNDLDALGLNDLVKKANDLNMLPQVARKVMEMINQDSTSASALAEVLEKDPNITASILKISNSAFYGLRREVTTVNQAIMILGFKSLKSMVIATSTKSLHKSFGITEQLMWDQSIGTAIAGKIIAPSIEVGELTFVGGLLHNVGQAVMNSVSPKAYIEVMKLAYNEGVEPVEAEMQVFGYSYTQVGYSLTEKWGLPASLSKIIRYHKISKLTEAEQKDAFSDETLKKAISCVQLATYLCRFLGVGYKDKKEDLVLTEIDGAKILGIEEEKMKVIIERAEEAISEEKSVFQ